MSNNVIQTSFAGGELSPTLYGHVDLAKYHVGAALMYNFFVDYRGGATSRPGTEFIARALYSDRPTRLIPFQFSTIQNYVLEFGDYYMRVIKDGAHVLEAAKTITGITIANPGVVTVPAHGYSNGDQVYFLVNGMKQIDEKSYFVASVTTNTFELRRWDNSFLNTSGYDAFISGTVARIYTAVSPYAAADLAMLKFTQSADVMTIVHPKYAPRDLIRNSETNWVFDLISIGASIAAPGPPILTASSGGQTGYMYSVTAVNADGEESVASVRNTVNSAVDIANTAGNISMTWTPVAGAVAYNVYKAASVNEGTVALGAPLGYMTTSTTNSAVDANIVPDFTYTAPLHTDPFTGGNWPGAVAYDQQRRVFAGSKLEPETFWMSKPGQYRNFDVSSPIVSDDAITGTLVSRQVNQIKYMISMPGGLIMLTSGGAWQVSGGGAGAPLTPTTIQATPQAYNGCADVEPIPINYDILYVQEKGTVVRDLSYSFYTNIYTGADLSIFSNHLFLGYEIKEWTYAEEPFKLIWCVRSDGALLSLTYLKEQEVAGWAQHATQGRAMSVTSIQENRENKVYLAVQRFVQGETRTYIERMHTRQMPYGAEDAWFVDSGLSNILEYPSATLKIDAPSGSGVLFTSSPGVFDSDSVGKIIRAGKGIAKVTSYIDSTKVRCQIIRAVQDIDTFRSPVVVWPQEAGSWSMTAPVKTVSGLDHLEGETVTILGDGNVFPDAVVLNGQVTISQPCSKIVVGLSYKCRLQTLYLDIGEPTIQGKRKSISALTARVVDTRGIKMGPSFDTLTEYKDRDLNTIGRPIDLFTGDQRAVIEKRWTTEGQLCIEQSYPLPASVLAVVPEIQIGDTLK